MFVSYLHIQQFRAGPDYVGAVLTSPSWQKASGVEGAFQWVFGGIASGSTWSFGGCQAKTDQPVSLWKSNQIKPEKRPIHLVPPMTP